MLRPYQQQSVNQLRALYGAGVKKALLVLPTGSGKTVVFCDVLKSLVEKGRRGLMVVYGRQLVDQAAARLAREGVPHGVIMAGRPMTRAPVQVCSIDTLRARKLAPPADLIVIDEAHLATTASYRELLASYPQAYILGVTATPFVRESLRHLADAVVAPIDMASLIAQGHLVRPRYVVPREMDLSTVRNTGGDYHLGDLAALYGSREVVGDIGETWGKFAHGRPTICFAPRVDVSLALVERFRGLGIRAEHVDAETSEEERRRLQAQLMDGRLDLLSNVGVLCTGVDLPPVSCVLLARATKSLNLYIQMAGRATRPFTGKHDCLILDHGNNVRTHGFLTDPRQVFLDGAPAVRRSTKANGVTVCPTCYAASPTGAATCHECGKEFPRRQQKAGKDKAGQLHEVSDSDEVLIAKSYLAELRRVQQMKGYKRGWLYHQLVGKVGQEIADQLMPKRELPPWLKRKLGYAS